MIPVLTTDIRWPSVVEIEVNVRCNRSCDYCPNAQLKQPTPNSFMEDDLYNRIIDQLASIAFSGRLSFHFYNEPLMRKDLAQLVSIARDRLPLAFFAIYTNGDLLTNSRYDELLAAGVDQFLVTRHSWDEFPDRPYQFVQYPSNFIISGRGGSVSLPNKPLTLPCFAPTEMMIVMFNGDVVLCHEDANRELVMGNLACQSLSEVWQSPSFMHLRSLLAAGRRSCASKVCKRCDNRLYPIPGGTI